MSRAITWVPLALLLAATLPMAACTSTATSQSSGEYVDDAAITTKVKAALLGDAGLSSFAIGVETYNNVVQLSGFVDTAALAGRAASVAAGVAGVRGVRNDLVVK